MRLRVPIKRVAFGDCLRIWNPLSLSQQKSKHSATPPAQQIFLSPIFWVVTWLVRPGPFPQRQGRQRTEDRESGSGLGHQTKGLMSETIAAHVRYKSLHISLPSSAKQEREMTEFCVVWGTRTTTANLSSLLKFPVKSSRRYQQLTEVFTWFCIPTSGNWLKKQAPLCRPVRIEGKLKPIATRSQTFSRALRRTHVFALGFDFFTGFSVSFVISRCDYFGFSLMRLNRKRLQPLIIK